MKTTRTLTGLLGASLLGLAVFAASAQTPPPESNDPAAQAQPVPAQAPVDYTAQAQPEPTQAQLDAEAELVIKDREFNRHCLRRTGSRIVERDKTGKMCVAASGRVYTREDIELTGEIDIAEALRKLDPAIR